MPVTKQTTAHLSKKPSVLLNLFNHPEQDPWLAVNLSMFFPGIGQIYAGKFFKGIIWAFCQVLFLIFGFWSIFSSSGNIKIGLLCLGIVTLIYLANLLDAFLIVYIAKNDKTLEKIPRIQKNPWFAVFASRFLPGLGQLYIGKTIAGLVFFVAFIVFKVVNVDPILSVIPALITAIAIYHVYYNFPSQRSAGGSSSFCFEQAQYTINKLTYRSLLAIMVGIIFAWGVIFNHLPSWFNQRIELFSIPSESMQPILQIDDQIFVYKSNYYSPHRKDIIVFHTPYIVKQIAPTSGEFYIKRIIGKPGEVVNIRDGIVYINNQSLKEPYIAQPPQYNWGPATVPADSYFVLGDNRNASFDSHEWGFLSKEDIYGQAYKIYWPMGRAQSLLD